MEEGVGGSVLDGRILLNCTLHSTKRWSGIPRVGVMKQAQWPSPKLSLSVFLFGLSFQSSTSCPFLEDGTMTTRWNGTRPERKEREEEL